MSVRGADLAPDRTLNDLTIEATSMNTEGRRRVSLIVASLGIGAVYALSVLSCGSPSLRSGAAAQAEPPVREAQRMLAEQLAASEADIGIHQIEVRQWADTSLDCPQPGFAYAQVITPGYRILLTHGDRTYEFHASASRVVYCGENDA